MHSFMQKLPLALIATFAIAGAASAQSSSTGAMSNDHMSTGAMSSGAMSSGAMSTDHMTAPAKAKPKVKPMHKAGAMAAKPATGAMTNDKAMSSTAAMSPAH